MYLMFIISLVGLYFAAMSSFIFSFKNTRWPLLIFVPLIAFCTYFISDSYHSVLGYPIQMQWKYMPDKFTVIYFRITEKETISLWIIDKDTTRLIQLPFDQKAEEGLEGERGTMGKGTPVTFKKTNGKGGKGSKKGFGKAGHKRGSGSEIPGQRWRYKVESKGDPIPGSALPPKEE